MQDTDDTLSVVTSLTQVDEYDGEFIYAIHLALMGVFNVRIESQLESLCLLLSLQL